MKISRRAMLAATAAMIVSPTLPVVAPEVPQIYTIARGLDVAFWAGKVEDVPAGWRLVRTMFSADGAVVVDLDKVFPQGQRHKMILEYPEAVLTKI